MDNKYVVGTPRGMGTHEDVILFSELLSHKDVATCLFKEGSIVGAGFFYIGPDGHVKVQGCSTSLRVDSRPGIDNILIEKLLGM